MKRRVKNIITIIMIICVASMILMALLAGIFQVKYFEIINRNRGFWVAFCIVTIAFVVMSSCIIRVKEQKSVWGMLIVDFFFSCVIFFMVFTMGVSGAIISHTDDINDVGLYDSRVSQILNEHLGMNSLPSEEVVAETEVLSYEYLYIQTFDDEIDISLKCRFLNEDSFNKEFERIKGKEGVNISQGDKVISYSFSYH